MAIQIRSFQPTIPPNTPIATPFTQAMSFPPMVVTRIEIKIPSGPRGVMGFAVGSSGVPVIPIQPGQWIVADDDDLGWDLDDFWDSGSWEFFGYNLGQFPHTVYLRFLLELVPPAPVAPVQPASFASLSSSGSTTSSTGGSTSSSTTSPTVAPLPPEAPQSPVTLPPPPVVTPPAIGPVTSPTVPPIVAPSFPT